MSALLLMDNGENDEGYDYSHSGYATIAAIPLWGCRLEMANNCEHLVLTTFDYVQYELFLMRSVLMILQI